MKRTQIFYVDDDRNIISAPEGFIQAVSMSPYGQFTTLSNGDVVRHETVNGNDCLVSAEVGIIYNNCYRLTFVNGHLVGEKFMGWTDSAKTFGQLVIRGGKLRCIQEELEF